MPTITGTIQDATETPIAGAVVSIAYTRPIVGYEGGAVVSNEQVFTANGSGQVVMSDVVPGHYTVTISAPPTSLSTTPTVLRKTTGTATDDATQTLQSFLDTDIAEITPSILQLAVAAAEQAEAFGKIYTETDAQLLSITIPPDVDVVQRMPSVTGQVAPQNIVTRWRRNASPGAEDFWTDATGATFTVAEITQAEILSTLTSALDAAFTDPAFSGQARIASGTMAAPSLAFANDLDTGIYYQNTNSIGFTAGGTRRAFLSSTAMQVDVPITGTAVVSSDSDVTAGRLLKTVAGPAQAFRRGNILGAVSQSGGVPTGAVIERGSNANGQYVRFADGTQICTHQITSNSASAVTWTYPVSFSGGLDAFLGLANGPDRIVTQSADNSATGTQAAFHAWTISGTPARTTYPCRLVAIGRWF